MISGGGDALAAQGPFATTSGEYGQNVSAASAPTWLTCALSQLCLPGPGATSAARHVACGSGKDGS